MEQQIGFCTTSDGVSIAYATLGEGAPLVYATGWPGHLAVEWEKPVAREFIQDLGTGFKLIRYDMRGSGLSESDVSDLSLDALVLDLEAVLDHLELERFPLLALGFLAGPIAITYAVAHPERVSQLVLYSAYLRGAQLTSPKRRQAMVDYVASFGLPMQAAIRQDGEKWADVTRIREASGSREYHAELLGTMYAVDVSELAERLSVPTLIMHARGDTIARFGQGRDLAARIPHAQFVPFGGDQPPWQQTAVLVPEIRRFLGVTIEEEGARTGPESVPLTILFTDMEGSTALTQRLGDAKAQELVRTHNRIVRDALAVHSGTEIKHTGDGIMASFASASRALECAIEVQRAFATEERTEQEPIRVKIGLNVGEPVAEEKDLFGTAVQLARRICDRAEPGQILASNVVRELAAGKGFSFTDRGETELRGFEEPVRLYEVRWREA